MSQRHADQTPSTTTLTSDTSAVWHQHIAVPDTPEGFTLRTAFPNNPDGVEMMLEQWVAGTEEPPHSHPGDDMTVVVEGKMSVRFYTREGDDLVRDGDTLYLNKGDVGYIKGGRIHDVQYIADCKLVYVHDKAFAFQSE